MKLTDLIKRSGRTLRSAKLRTLLTALAIAVGGFTLTLTLAAGNGVRDYTTKLVSSNFDPAELLVGRDREISNSGAPKDTPQEFDDSVTSFQSGGPSGSFQLKQVTKEDVDKIRAIPEIEQVRENLNLSIRYITRAGQKRYTGSAEAYNPAQKPEIKYGQPPALSIEKGTILLPDVYLEPLGFSSPEAAIGQEITVNVQQPFSLDTLGSILNGQSPEAVLNLQNIDPSKIGPKQQTFTYKISAIIKKPATSIGFGVLPLLMNSDDAKSVYDFTSKGTSNYQKYLFVYARVKNGDNRDTRQKVEKILEDDGFFVQSSEDIQKTITQFVNILQGLVGALGAVTLVASVFGIVNTQYISVLERTREIGLMKALGMSKKNISRLFVLEAAWIGFIGGVIGSLAGWTLGTLINPWISNKLDLGPGLSLIIFELWQIIILILALMLIAALAGVLPARKAAKLDPVEALRTE
jgi:putative ABC transport system permease protein